MAINPLMMPQSGNPLAMGSGQPGSSAALPNALMPPMEDPAGPSQQPAGTAQPQFDFSQASIEDLVKSAQRVGYLHSSIARVLAKPGDATQKQITDMLLGAIKHGIMTPQTAVSHIAKMPKDGPQLDNWLHQHFLSTGRAQQKLAEAIAMKGIAAREPQQGGAPMPAGPQSIPPEAVSQLSEGAATTFGNGQVWTLRGGQPERVQ